MFYGLDPDDDGRVLWQTRVGRGGEAGGIEWGFSTDGKNAYVPVVDMNADFMADGLAHCSRTAKRRGRLADRRSGPGLHRETVTALQQRLYRTDDDRWRLCFCWNQ